jgi:hypothetical protein
VAARFKAQKISSLVQTRGLWVRIPFKTWMCGIKHMNVCVGPKKGRFRNDCAAELSLRRPPGSGHVAAMKTTETCCVATMKTAETGAPAMTFERVLS